MRRTILGALAAASLLAPAVAFARIPVDTNAPVQQQPNGVGNGHPFDQHRSIKPNPQAGGSYGNPGNASLGNGMMNGNEPGHVDSPGVTKVDPETRGPINDVQPGRGTNDTRQSSNPPPAR